MNTQRVGTFAGIYIAILRPLEIKSALHPAASKHIYAYLERSGTAGGALFTPLRGLQNGAGMTANCIYALIGDYAKAAGIKVAGPAYAACAQPRQPMPWSTKPTSPRCRLGLGTRISVPRGSATAASYGWGRTIHRP